MLPLWLNVGWLHIFNPENPVQSGQSRSGARWNGHLQTLSASGPALLFRVGAVLFAFAFPLGVDRSIFSLFSYKSKFHWSDVCVDHDVFSEPLSGFWKDLIFIGLLHWLLHHRCLLKEPAVLIASSNANRSWCVPSVLGPLFTSSCLYVTWKYMAFPRQPSTLGTSQPLTFLYGASHKFMAISWAHFVCLFVFSSWLLT